MFRTFVSYLDIIFNSYIRMSVIYEIGNQIFNLPFFDDSYFQRAHGYDCHLSLWLVTWFFRMMKAVVGPSDPGPSLTQQTCPQNRAIYPPPQFIHTDGFPSSSSVDEMIGMSVRRCAFLSASVLCICCLIILSRLPSSPSSAPSTRGVGGWWDEGGGERSFLSGDGGERSRRERRGVAASTPTTTTTSKMRRTIRPVKSLTTRSIGGGSISIRRGVVDLSDLGDLIGDGAEDGDFVGDFGSAGAGGYNTPLLRYSSSEKYDGDDENKNTKIDVQLFEDDAPITFRRVQPGGGVRYRSWSVAAGGESGNTIRTLFAEAGVDDGDGDGRNEGGYEISFVSVEFDDDGDSEGIESSTGGGRVRRQSGRNRRRYVSGSVVTRDVIYSVFTTTGGDAGDSDGGDGGLKRATVEAVKVADLPPEEEPSEEEDDGDRRGEYGKDAEIQAIPPTGEAAAVVELWPANRGFVNSVENSLDDGSVLDVMVSLPTWREIAAKLHLECLF